MDDEFDEAIEVLNEALYDIVNMDCPGCSATERAQRVLDSVGTTELTEFLSWYQLDKNGKAIVVE